jgi:Family of unknown function (DUF6152)
LWALDRLRLKGVAMQRRFLIASPLLLGLPAAAHHGWSSFDQTRPLYLEGKVVKSVWRNPHAELQLELPAGGVKLPADLAARGLPAQTAPVDGPALLKTTTLPTRKDRRWEIELAPLSRLQAWAVPEVKVGDSLAVIGFTFTGEKGDAILRAEFLFAGGNTFGLRSSPA